MLDFLYLFVIPKRGYKIIDIFIAKWNAFMFRIINFIMPIYYRYTKLYRAIDSNSNINGCKIIISLTSMPDRIKQVCYCIESLMRQKEKPHKIILWIEHENFDIFSEKLNRYLKYGLDIRGCEDIKPHKKYYYAFKEFSKDIIITVDDDVFYPSYLISNLVECARKYPNSIVCYRAHEITFQNNRICKYSDWNGQSPGIKGPSHKLVATGVGGIVYRPQLFYPEVLNIGEFTKICLYADDLWLKTMEVLSDIKVAKVGRFTKEWATIKYSQVNALTSANVYNNRNDMYMNNLIEKYKINVSDIND